MEGGDYKMKGYEVTERGKIIIAIVIVICIFVIPAIVLAVKAWSSSPPLPDNPQHTEEPASDDEINDGPLPDGSGFNPNDPHDSGDTEQGSFDPPVDPDDLDDPDETGDAGDPDNPGDSGVVEEPKYGPVSISRTHGTMTFRFSPGMQDSIDTASVSMIGDFLSSPKNTSDSQILIEMPLLSDDDVTKFINAISDTFASLGVEQKDLLFMTYQPSSEDSDSNLYDIRLSFSQASVGK